MQGVYGFHRQPSEILTACAKFLEPAKDAIMANDVSLTDKGSNKMGDLGETCSLLKLILLATYEVGEKPDFFLVAKVRSI